MNFRIVRDMYEIPLEEVHRLLKTTYWANQRPPEQIGHSMRHSECYGLRVEGVDRLVGFARVITDFATTYYLCDIVIDPEYRGRGLGTALVGHIVSRPEYAGLRGLLVTRDAHALYRKFGFEVLDGRAMAKAPNG